MATDLAALKAQHQDIVRHHARYRVLSRLADIALCLALLALVVLLVLYRDDFGARGACSTTLCRVSPWVATALVAGIALLFGLTYRHRARGVRAYRQAMAFLRLPTP